MYVPMDRLGFWDGGWWQVDGGAKIEEEEPMQEPQQ